MEAAYCNFELCDCCYELFENTKCLPPGQHPEEDDALMSSGFSKAVVWRRGLVVGLKETGRAVSVKLDISLSFKFGVQSKMNILYL